ncbi:MAG: class I SAM-dependent methyltransferase family protein [Candidatus Thermoplasmatota archaeon]|nr:class I SAM-dependent methyltransferase family protein [Candidatus Thermoplasmatota archaeon]
MENVAVAVEKKYADRAIKFLLENNFLDDTRRVWREGNKVEIPVKNEITFFPFPFSLKEQERVINRGHDIPFKKIKKEAKKILSTDEIAILPKKWEKIGDILVLKFSGKIDRKEEVSKIYAEVLKCRAVLEDMGGITGIKREPMVKHIYGDENTETIHVENKIKFKLDVSKIMFSSGNVDERIRMAYIGNEGETVVDMFAGIGYFSIPMAVYSKVKVYACEINPAAYHYLKKNIELNGVEQNMAGLHGDCRKVAPRGIANRILMGYLQSKEFLPYAMKILKTDGGIIHYHMNCPKNSFPEVPFSDVKSVAHNFGRTAELLKEKEVKSYAPGIIHGVLDIKIF